LVGCLTYRLWNSKGKIDSGYEGEMVTRLRNLPQDNLIQWAETLFVTYASKSSLQRTLSSDVVVSPFQRPRVSDSLETDIASASFGAIKDYGGNLFGRFWDYNVADNDYDRSILKDGLYIIFPKKTWDDIVKTCKTSEDGAREKIKAALDSVLGRQDLRFKPPLGPENILREQEWKDLGNDPSDWRILEPHPANLYTIAVSRDALELLQLADNPFWGWDFPIPSEARSKELDDAMDRAKGKKAGETRTAVTATRIEGTNNLQRDPTQPKCMHSTGFSANHVCGTSRTWLGPTNMIST
jgi:hypothetical protein